MTKTFCNLPPPGWVCTRDPNHDGPCAAMGWERYRAQIEGKLEMLDVRLAGVTAQKDNAYRERDMVVSALFAACRAAGMHVYYGRHDPDDVLWDAEWRDIVYIDLPQGQVSWHIHESEVTLFPGHLRVDGKWDGHTTDEKYRRLLDFATMLHRMPAPEQMGLVFTPPEPVRDVPPVEPKIDPPTPDLARCQACDRLIDNHSPAELAACTERVMSTPLAKS